MTSMFVDDRTFWIPSVLGHSFRLPWVARGTYVQVARHQRSAPHGWCAQKFSCFVAAGRIHTVGSAATDYTGSERHRIYTFRWMALVAGWLMDRNWL